MIETLNELGIEKIMLTIIKAVNDDYTENIMVHGKKTENVSFIIENKKKIFTFSTYLI